MGRPKGSKNKHPKIPQGPPCKRCGQPWEEGTACKPEATEFTPEGLPKFAIRYRHADWNEFGRLTTVKKANT